MYVAGIDPGLTETGMVLLSPEGRYLSGITFRAARQGPDLQRIVNLADAVVATLKSWRHDYGVGSMLVGIETPVLKATNVTSYRKQVSLLHEIEAGMWRWRNDVNDSGFKLAISEVGPSQSKRTATGDGAADKDKVVAASPFAGDLMPRPTREALADAWAHAVTAAKTWYNLIDVQALARERLDPEWRETRVIKLEVESDRT